MTALHAGGKQDGALGTLDGGQLALGFRLRGIAVAAVFLLADDAALALGGHEFDHLRHGAETKVRGLDNGRGDGAVGLAAAFVSVNGQGGRPAFARI